MSAPEISVAVPVYYGEASVNELHRRLVATLTGLGASFELVLVDDASPDRSWELISALAASDPRVKGIRFTRNFGQHAAITAALEYAKGRWVVLMDCDLQDLPEDIPRLYAEAKKGFDCVVGLRDRGADPSLRVFFSRAYYRVLGWLLSRRFDARVGTFRILSRRSVEAFLGLRERVRLFGELMDWLSFPSAYVPVNRGSPANERSTYTFTRLLKMSTDLIVVHLDRILGVAAGCGFLISAASFIGGFLYAGLAVYRGTSVAGWASLILSIFFFSGLMIGMLGLIGLSMGRNLQESRARPHFVVLERKNLDS